MIKKLSREQKAILKYRNYLFNSACNKLVFMIDNGIKDILDKTGDKNLRHHFYYALVNAVFEGSEFYYSLLDTAGVSYNINYDLDFETGLIEYTEEKDQKEFDPLVFMLNSTGFNDKWKKELTEIYENYPTEQ